MEQDFLIILIKCEGKKVLIIHTIHGIVYWISTRHIQETIHVK